MKTFIKKYNIVNLFLFVILAVSLPNIMEYIIYTVTPFEFNVNHTSRIYDDVCTGDELVLLHLVRKVRPVSGVNAYAVTELVRFQDEQAIETPYKYERTYTYQQSDKVITLEVEIPNTLTPGIYGFVENVTIYPYWGVQKSKTFFPEDAFFSIKDC